MEIKIVKKILEKNDAAAGELRVLFAQNKILSVNLMSSPGSGKTALLDRTLEMLAGDLRCAVIEGDIATTLDAERLARHNAPLVQVNTDTFGGDCHLEANMIAGAVEQLDLDALDIVFIENVGNLVCPAEFDLGEDMKVSLLSATEGEDKPLKYPLMFRVCGTAIITKCDLLGVLDFDAAEAADNVRKVNPDARILQTSAKTGQGMHEWIALLKERLGEKQ
jgi:hydrogenase nickel incorporation protein HypB